MKTKNKISPEIKSEEETSEKINYNLIMVTCGRCKYSWNPRKETKPRMCPFCRCRKWDTYKPKKKKK